MKALSGYAEWFWLMAKGWKDCENRPWSLYRYFKPADLPVSVYLHASKTPASQDDIDFMASTAALVQPAFSLAAFQNTDWSKYRGKIIGEVTITGESRYGAELPPQRRSPWFFGPYGFWVVQGELYDKPIPYRGQLGFFDVKLPGAKA